LASTPKGSRSCADAQGGGLGIGTGVGSVGGGRGTDQLPHVRLGDRCQAAEEQQSPRLVIDEERAGEACRRHAVNVHAFDLEALPIDPPEFG